MIPTYLKGCPRKRLFYFIAEGKAKAIQWECKRGRIQFDACIRLFQCSGTLGKSMNLCSNNALHG